MSIQCLVYAECKDGRLRRVALEALGAALRIAGEDGAVHALVSGADSAALAEAAAELAARGAAVVHVADDPALRDGAPEAVQAAIAAAIEAAAPDAVLLGHTSLGREVAPRVAAAIGAGHAADVTAIEPGDDGGVVFARPLYAGKAIERLRIAPGATWVVSVRPNNLPPAETLPAGADPGAVTALAYRAPTLWTTVRSVVRKTAGAVDLAEADVIVSGGRGVRSADGFAPLQQLASLLGGAVGASRGACDAGYCDYSLQIGQTGKVVTPQLYIACGISGAIQHLAGMSGSRVIVAVNKDAEAPIFGIADYGVVGDLFEIVPLLTNEFRRMLGPATT